MRERGQAGSASLISATTAPAPRVAPISALRPVTTPALWALSGCSIFIASNDDDQVALGDGLALLDGDLDDGACIGEVSESPLAAAPAPPPALRLAFLAPAAGARWLPARGQDDLDALAGDLDRHALALAGVLALGGAAGVRLDLVVVVGLDPGRVDVERAVLGGVRRVLDHRAVERMTVGMPSTSNSASARRERSSACWRVAPVTTSLATSESNEPGMVSPSV